MTLRFVGPFGVLAVVSMAWSAQLPDAKDSGERQLLLEASVPPIGLFDPTKDKVEAPLIGKTDLKVYADTSGAKLRIRDQVRKTQIVLWATSQAAPPKELYDEVRKEQKELKLEILVEKKDPKAKIKDKKFKPRKPEPPLWLVRVPIPRNGKDELTMKNRVLNASVNLARVVAKLEGALEDLQEVHEARDKECPRLRAQFDLMQAAVLLRLAHLEDYGFALGSMRRESPPAEAADKAWALKTKDRVADTTGKKYFRAGQKLVAKLIKEHPDTTWEAMAKQWEKLELGVEWTTEK